MPKFFKKTKTVAKFFKKIKTVPKFLGSFFLKPKYKTVWIEYLPKNLKKRTIYIVGGREHPFQAVFLCPKSCGKTMTLNISEQYNKWERWQITEHKDGTLSVHPSIWMKKFNCGCHYWFKKSRIVWTKQQAVSKLSNYTNRHRSS